MTRLDSTVSDLCRLSASELARRIADGELSSVEVVQAHIERIEATAQAINAVVVSLFDEALANASRADSLRATGAPLGPLHGVPFTVKECFAVTGTRASLGIASSSGKVADHDGVLVRRLKHAGGILLGKTNVPQLMLMHETDNPVFGRTNNPWNVARSPGGSSGGEAAIVAVGGSPLGLANDLGGSIRQPAHSCGICGLKPTSDRLTNSGSRANFFGMQAIAVQPGPLARSVADLELAMRVLVTPSPEETAYADGESPVPWADSHHVSVQSLRIGVWADDGYFSPSPAIRRAVNEAAEALRERGCQVVDFEPLDIRRMMQTYLGILGADGGAHFRRLLKNRPVDWRVRRILRASGLPRWLRPMMAWLLSASGQRRLEELVRWTGPISADRYWQLVGHLKKYSNEFFQRMEQQQIDVLLFPPYGLPALTHGSSGDVFSAASYAFLPNLLGIPAGVVPATSIRPEEENRPAGERGGRLVRQVEAGSAGLPVGVQVASLPWREDRVLAVMEVLEAHFSRQADFASPPLSTL